MSAAICGMWKTPDVASLIRATTPLGRRIAIARQYLRGAADGAPEGFVEGDGTKLPAARPALPFHLPLRDPAERAVVPHQPPDQGHFASLPGGFDARLRQRRFAGQHDT